MTNKQFVEELSKASIERQVEDAYNEVFKNFFKGIEISYPFQCDGYFEFKNEDRLYRTIVEYKYDLDYSSKVEMAKTACQLLFYLKKFEKNGRPLPNVCVIADKNECFVFHSNVLLKYLDFDGVDWNKAPSSAGFVSPELLVALSEDADFNPFVFRVNEWFDVSELKNKILDLATNTHRLVHITEHNIDKIFNAFCERVVIDKKKISPNDLVGLFFGCICDKENYYLHPGKKNTLVSPLGTFRVDSRKFEAFFKYFSNEVSPKEKLRLAAISDRLIEDTNRRRKGEFYTPTPFVDKAHEMISEAFGENWKDKYVVWDCCCGTKNLTRDYKFKELYCSTLEQAELDIAKQYNQEAVSFVFDFLNDPLDKVPEGLQKALKEGKKIIFFINPPYGKSSGVVKNGLEENTATSTAVYSLMKENNIGGCSSMLEGQFLYRINELSKKFPNASINIGIFCKNVYMTAPFFKKFRNEFYKNFSFNSGCVVDGTIFGTIGGIGISFVIWKKGIFNNSDIILKKLDYDKELALSESGEKTIYNLDNKNSINDWAKSKDKNKDNIVPILKSQLVLTNNERKVSKDFIGYFYSHSVDVFQSQQYIGIFSSSFNQVGFEINKDNFDKVIDAFAARRLIHCNPFNDKDQFMEPTIKDEKIFQSFEKDALVFSLFENKSNQSSLRNIEANGKSWNIPNEFFWMSKSEIEDLANENSLDETYADARTSSDRFVYNMLQEIELSLEAKAVLDKANELVRKSFKYRKIFNEIRPEVQILNWDCGWYQIKQLLKEFMPEELKEFNAFFKVLADKMRPQVYELGFLKK